MKWRQVAGELPKLLFGCTIVNQNGVEFWFLPKKEMGGEVILTHDLGISDSILFCSKWYRCVDEFLRDHAISGEDDLDRITSEDLMTRFEKGEARMYCNVGKQQYLFFKRKGEMLYAEDYLNKKHLVSQVIVLTDDYIDYTKAYYSIGHS